MVIALPVPLHVHHSPPLGLTPHRVPLSKLPMGTCGRTPTRAWHRCGARRPLTALLAAHSSPLQHLQIAIRVAERGYLPPADDADVCRSACPPCRRRSPPPPSCTNHCLSVSHLDTSSLPVLPITCSGGTPYTFSVHGAHELDPAAPHDEGLEAVARSTPAARASAGRPSRCTGLFVLACFAVLYPIASLSARILRWSSWSAPPQRSPSIPFSPPAQSRLHVPRKQRLEWLLFLPLRMFRRHRLYASMVPSGMSRWLHRVRSKLP